MNTMIFVVALAAGVWQFVDLYAFRFDELTEEELIRRSFYWAPLIFGEVCPKCAKGPAPPRQKTHGSHPAVIRHTA